MNSQTRQVVEECTAGSDAERMSFPEVIGALMAAGIERYHADLIRAEKTYHMPDGATHVVANAAISSEPARDFSPAGVEAAIRAIQSRAIGYKAFCERILAAGCVGYLVSLEGRRAVYYGRTGDLHVEHFPTLA